MCVSDFQLFKPRELINGLRYEVKIWYTSKGVTPLQSLPFLYKFMPNLKFYENWKFFKNICGSSNSRKILAVVLKLHTNTSINDDRNISINDVWYWIWPKSM